MMNRLRFVSLSLLLAASLSTASAAEPKVTQEFVSVRMGESEYRNTIADIFGADIAIKGQFEPGVRTDGLLAVGQHTKSFSPVSLEYYDNMARGIAAHRVQTSRDCFEDQQLRHRRHFVELPHPVYGTTIVEGPRVALSRVPGQALRAAPTLGRDNQYVLSEILGYEEQRISELIASGAMG